jgi:hypothetical protein
MITIPPPSTEPPVAYERRSYEELLLVALDYKCEFVKAQDNQLLIDLDSFNGTEIKFDAFIWAVLQETHGVTKVEDWASRNGRRHVLITLARSVKFAERIAWQLALGSDPRREVGLLLDMQLPLGDIGQTNCLFKPKKEA